MTTSGITPEYLAELRRLADELKGVHAHYSYPHQVTRNIQRAMSAIPALLDHIEKLEAMMPHTCATCWHCPDYYEVDGNGKPLCTPFEPVYYRCKINGALHGVGHYCNIDKWQLKGVK